MSIAGCKILVIDDDIDILELTQLQLSRLKCQSSSALTGDDALKAYQQAQHSSTPFDAVILDLNLACGESGISVANNILAFDAAAKIIVSSGDSDSDEMNSPEKFGFKASLEKGFNKDILKQTLNAVL